MSVVFTGTDQGRFTATGNSVMIPLVSDLDWMYVYNWTKIGAAASSIGVQYYWQRGMPQGQGIEYASTTATGALVASQLAANTGFFLFDNSHNIPGPSVAITAISTGTPPVVSTASTAGLVPGTIVRIFNSTGALQLSGLDYTVGTVVPSTSFQLAYGPTIAAAATGGQYRIIPYDPLYYPVNRTITNITQATQAIVTLSVTHGFQVGQAIRFVMPTVTPVAFGMTELDGKYATIVAVSTANNTITVDIDTTGFTAFAFPLTANVPFTPAQVVPVGENTAAALFFDTNILSDATINIGKRGMLLTGGTNGPAGSVGDIVYWVAGKSFSVRNGTPPF